MNADTAGQVGSLLLRKLGLNSACLVSGGELVITPSDHHANEAFAIHFQPGWRSAEAVLSPGSFAGAMVRSMGKAGEQEKLLFAGYVSALQKDGVQVSMSINGGSVNPSDTAGWATDWNAFSISLRKTALVFDLNNDKELLPVADLLVTPLAGMAIALVGTEKIDDEGEIEGAAVQYLATRYERSKLNRDACIRFHGTDCAGCGFSFGKFYGDAGEGYIEVHHIESVATSGVRRVDPVTDLVPLCSNCHSFVHKFTPPLPIGELRDLVETRRFPCSNA
jgi:5-methylcytosine-specific restriction protein A